MIFVGLIRFVIDYGCVAYGSACKTLLGKLDVVQAQALRIVVGLLGRRWYLRCRY